MRPLALTLLALAAAAPARAQAPPVLTAVTADEMAAVVREAGAPFGLTILATPQAAPDTSFVVLADVAFPAGNGAGADTLRFFVGLDACEDAACAALSAVAFFGGGEGAPTADELNVWNASRRLTRAYLTPDGLALQSDFDLQGGVTREAVARFVRSYLISLVTFADALQGPEEAGAAPPGGE